MQVFHYFIICICLFVPRLILAQEEFIIFNVKGECKLRTENTIKHAALGVKIKSSSSDTIEFSGDWMTLREGQSNKGVFIDNSGHYSYDDIKSLYTDQNVGFTSNVFSWLKSNLIQKKGLSHTTLGGVKRGDDWLVFPKDSSIILSDKFCVSLDETFMENWSIQIVEKNTYEIVYDTITTLDKISIGVGMLKPGDYDLILKRGKNRIRNYLIRIPNSRKTESYYRMLDSFRCEIAEFTLSERDFLFTQYKSLHNIVGPEYSDKHALLVGVTEYAPETGWLDINAEQDLILLESMLYQKEFHNEYIHRLDGKVSKGNIMDAIEVDILEKVCPGDMFFFHFSGHGQQIEDDNGDEPDGLDEALVPYDAPRKNYIINESGKPSLYDYSKHVRDDELGVALQKIRSKVGGSGHVFVSIDACHSGSATRGISNYRGTSTPNVRSDWSFSGSRGLNTEEKGFGIFSISEDLSPMVAIFASGPMEVNKETLNGDNKWMGSLSLSLYEAMSEMSNKTSYRYLFEKIKRKMNDIVPDQTPQIEGDLDVEVLGKDFYSKPQYFSVDKVLDNDTLIVDVGSLFFLDRGSTISFYKPDTRDTSASKPLATGRVHLSSLTKSVVVIDNNYSLDSSNAENSWCYVTGNKMPHSRIRVFTDNVTKHSLQNLANNAYFLDFVIDSTAADLNVRKNISYGKTSFDITESQGDLLMNSTDLNTKRQVLNRIRSYIVAKKLREWVKADQSYFAQLDLISKDSCIQNSPDRGWVLEEGCKFKVAIANERNKSHIGLIDITPQDEFSLLLPNSLTKKTDCLVPFKGFFESTNYFETAPPYGQHYFLLILSANPLNLEGLIDNVQNVSRGDNDPIDKDILLDDKVGIYLIPYSIVEKGELSGAHD